MMQRYRTSHLDEDQYQPGSRGLVLKNLLGIQSKNGIDQAENDALRKAEDSAFRVYSRTHKFSALDICQMHHNWLGHIYPWAGQYRQVNISKGDFPFAAAIQIPKLMKEFERGQLHEFTPCNFDSKPQVIKTLAHVHVELLLIHPFREGNGRIARLLATLMALQAGFPVLDFRKVVGYARRRYFAAVQAGMDRNYDPMERVFNGVLRQTLGTFSV